MQKQWMLYTKRADFEALAKEKNISPLAIKIMVNRGLDSTQMDSFLSPNLQALYDGALLKDMEKAVDILEDVIRQRKKLRIIGDYDIDGVCASYIYLSAFRRLTEFVDCDIPNRIKDGYGINENIIEKALEDNIEWIITCDNGIAAFAAVQKAKDLGLGIIITDHHEVFKENGEDSLPKADAIVNPKRTDCRYPFKGICGAMVAFKVVHKLYERFGIESQAWQYLDFAAIATIGDVMSLRDENRSLVKYGLKAIEETKNKGLRALLRVCGLEYKKLSPYHIGFQLGPCINAGGRLESAKLALRLFMEEDDLQTEILANDLLSLNEVRKEMTQKGLEEAVSIVEKEFHEDKVLVVYLPDCHESLAGIIAGRLKERYHKPSIVLTDSEHGDLKGSARSIEAYHIFEKLQEADALLSKYGGHPMAAGLSLPKENLATLRKLLNQHCDVKEEDFIPKIWIDSVLPFGRINDTLIADLERLEPFGNGNEKPSFALKNVQILNYRIMGKDQNVIKLRLQDEYGYGIDGLLFQEGEKFVKEMADYHSMDIIYFPNINEYMGMRTIQIMIQEYRFI